MTEQKVNKLSSEELRSIAKRGPLELYNNNTVAESGYPGVSFRKDRSLYCARIRVNKKTKHLGEYKELDDALRARLKAEIKFYGRILRERQEGESAKYDYDYSGKRIRGTIKDLTGEKFKYFTVLHYIPNAGHIHDWVCKCRCGKRFIASSNDINKGRVTSCGCMNKRKLKGDK